MKGCLRFGFVFFDWIHQAEAFDACFQICFGVKIDDLMNRIRFPIGLERSEHLPSIVNATPDFLTFLGTLGSLEAQPVFLYFFNHG